MSHVEAALERFLSRVVPLLEMRVQKDKPPGWRILHQIADSIVPGLRRAFLRALAAAREDIDAAAVAAALRRGDINRAVTEIARAWDANGGPTLTRKMAGPFLQGFQRAGVVSVDLVSPEPFTFVVDNPRALRWIEQHGGELIVQLGDDTIAGIRRQLVRMMDNGLSARDAAEAIKEVNGFGLTDRLANAVENYRAGLLAQNVAAGRIERMVARYHARLLDYRAMNIARTESMYAVNAGYHETLLQAVDTGLLSRATTERVWETAQDGQVCEQVCQPMQGKTAPVGQPFSNGLLFPPAHPGACRCTVVTRQVKAVQRRAA